jgi:hypothetical protein
VEVVSPWRRLTAADLDMAVRENSVAAYVENSTTGTTQMVKGPIGTRPATSDKEYGMRYMSMLKFDETNSFGPPPPELQAAMGAYIEEGLRSGKVVEVGGLLPSVAGAVVSLADGTIKVTDGPFTEARELVGGYAVIEVHSKAEAIEDARRLMQIHADHWPGFSGSCEIRQLSDPDPGPTAG